MSLWQQARYTLARIILPARYREALDLGVDVLNSLETVPTLPPSTLPREIEEWLQRQDFRRDK